VKHEGNLGRGRLDEVIVAGVSKKNGRNTNAQWEGRGNTPRPSVGKSSSDPVTRGKVWKAIYLPDGGGEKYLAFNSSLKKTQGMRGAALQKHQTKKRM